MITRLLVANRAEIASRVFATCRRLGIETVAVHSDPDSALPFVRDADHAVRLPGSTPAETYLDTTALLAAARASGADAVHPGYGFLSESAGFARAVLDAGLTWLGPAPGSIEAMGSKIRAKELMREAGVPVLEAPSRPADADLPLLVKASAGGGGRGMRVVRRLADLEAEIAAAAAEAASAFGDGTVFVEPYVERGRHVEVQIWGDAAGTVSVLGARDCSVQRRHQKIVEEAPPPGISAAVLTAIHDAARAAGEALGYTGVGTVEFLYDPATERFWFLEMNTRLQVEHPVTEAVTGLDLVQLQVRAAEGGLGVVEPESAGHAVEVRLYAEDPAADHQPQSGLLARLDVEHDAAFAWPEGASLRLDAGFAAGDEVSTHYDAMLAKLICRGPSRAAVLRRLAGVLRRARLHGLRTNRDELVAVLTDPGFVAGELSTGMLASVSLAAAVDEALPVAAALAIAESEVASRRVQQGLPPAWRNVVSGPQRTEFEGAVVEWWGGRDGYRVEGVEVVSVSPDEVRLSVGGVASSYRVAQTRGPNLPGGGLAPREVWVDGPVASACLREVPRFTDPAAQQRSGSLLAPMPGTVIRVLATAGQPVAAGDPVLVLEAMKMQHQVTAPQAGVVVEISVETGAQVAAGEVLAVVDTDSSGVPERGTTR